MKNIYEYIRDTKDVINYCEACIYRDGKIEDCTPSHIYYFLDNVLSESRDTLENLIPMSADVISWLVSYSGCIAVYTDFCIVPVEVSKEQLESLKILQSYGRISDNYLMCTSNEYELCKALDENDIDRIKIESEKRVKYNLINGYMFKI